MSRTWRRDLFQAERRVNLYQLDEQWTTAETALVDALTPVLNQVLERLVGDVENILESGNYSELKEVKPGYKDKLVNIMRQHLFDAFKMGKVGVYHEFHINKDVIVDAKMKSYFGVKSDTIVNDLLDKIKNNAVFIALAGINAGKTTLQIVADIKGPAYQPSGV
jgi:hypothetical protein